MNLLDSYPFPQPAFGGYRDADGRFVPFPVVDEVFDRARRIRTRVLLRLVLTDNGELEGMLYTHAGAANR
ncbi:MAG: hypothetical protein IT495_00855 [Gammaproteobacteria bacterium]|nr:hypothetical protein [Gammaproteobacteria bacterium]